MIDKVRPVSAMTILDDISAASARCRAMGFEAVPGCTTGVAGFKAGKTCFLLVTTDMMRGDFAAETVDQLAGRTVPYIYVRSVDDALGALGPTARVVQRVSTRENTDEAVVNEGAEWYLLAATPKR